MNHIGCRYQDFPGTCVRENLCISERVVTQCWKRRERISRARHLALSHRLSKRDMQAASKEYISPNDGGKGVDHLVELDRLRVVFVSTEVAPWSKVGGLADVLGALPKALAGLDDAWNLTCSTRQHGAVSRKKHVRVGDCRIWSVSPMYEEYEGLVDCGLNVPIPEYHIHGQEDDVEMKNARLFDCMEDGVRRVFVKHPLLDMNRVKARVDTNQHPSLTYVDADGGVYDCRNMDARYDTLAWGALAAAAMLPDDDDVGGKRNVVFVLNDWPTALQVLRLKRLIDSRKDADLYENLSVFEKDIIDSFGVVKNVFCIHNLAYQGVFSMESIRDSLHLSPDLLLPLATDLPWEDVVEKIHGTCKLDVQGLHLDDKEDAKGTVNFMRAALLLSDQIVTVSPYYAEEIMSENNELNCGMGDILKHRKVVGIMNGIDVCEWDPISDVHTPLDAKYGVISAPRGKSIMKKYLQCRLGLDEDEDAILIVFIGRLTEQKGIDVLLRSIVRILPQKPAPKPSHAIEQVETKFSDMRGCRVQIAVLGTGDQWMERAVESLEYNFPGNAKGLCTFSEELAHWMLAAADFAVIPSKFEPCGLIAQCAARYGAVPIMTATGGLKNLGDEGVGILVSQGTDTRKNVDSLVDGVAEAAKLYKSDAYRSKQIACMEHDFSWDKSAKDWQYVIAKVLCM